MTTIPTVCNNRIYGRSPPSPDIFPSNMLMAADPTVDLDNYIPSVWPAQLEHLFDTGHYPV